MTNKRIFNNLKTGMPVISPDVWDKIKDAHIEIAEPKPDFKYHNKFYNYTIAATCVCLALIIIIAPNIINRSENNFFYSGIPMESQVNSSNSACDKTTLNIIKTSKQNGELISSKKTTDEIILLLPSYNGDFKNVYEDDQYIYYFKSDGALIEMARITEPNSQIDVNVDETQIKAKSVEIINKYYPELPISELTFSIDNKQNTYVAWSVRAKRYVEGTCLTNILITFDGKGDIVRLNFQGDIIKNHNQNYKEAINIAFGEIEKSEYGFDMSAKETFNVLIKTLYDDDNNEYYSITIDNITLISNERYKGTIGFHIDSKTFEILKIIY